MQKKNKNNFPNLFLPSYLLISLVPYIYFVVFFIIVFDLKKNKNISNDFGRMFGMFGMGNNK